MTRINPTALCTLLASLAVSGCFGTESTNPPLEPTDAGGGADGGYTDSGLRDAGARDASPSPIDAGCPSTATLVDTVECMPPVRPGALATVVVQHHSDRCCADATVGQSVRRAGAGVLEVTLYWSACDCADGGTCAPTATATTVDLLGSAAPEGGTYLVRVGDQSCMVTVPPRVCAPAVVSEVRMPRVLLVGGASGLAVTLRSRTSAGCSCVPDASVAAGPSAVDLQLCDCCETCGCVDPGYEGSATGPMPRPGDYPIGTPLGARTLSVRNAGDCRTITATALEVVGPDPALRHGGPRIWWAHVTGEESLCCVSALPAVARGMSDAVTIDLDLRECAVDTCTCTTPPTPIDAWMSLGERFVAGETYTVRLPGVATTTFSDPGPPP